MSSRVAFTMLSLLVLASLAVQEAPTKSIAKMVTDLMEPAPVPVASIKEWTIDWQADLDDETRSAFIPSHQAVDLKKLMEDILIGKILNYTVLLNNVPLKSYYK